MLLQRVFLSRVLEKGQPVTSGGGNARDFRMNTTSEAETGHASHHKNMRETVVLVASRGAAAHGTVAGKRIESTIRVTLR